MKLDYMHLFLLLFVLSVAGGFAFQSVYDYAMAVGSGLAIVFLFAAAYCKGRKTG
ncbi:hypothetical protein [Salsuginibacillus kocurii]|uniref:hypothetical protein n=1 Tax=Salsuginibacillus kocurii TaxID=427078 RepID=UPI0003698360|nr:hypothetical protein [Salsuginibacillus kocurii]